MAAVVFIVIVYLSAFYYVNTFLQLDFCRYSNITTRAKLLPPTVFVRGLFKSFLPVSSSLCQVDIRLLWCRAVGLSPCLRFELDRHAPSRLC